MKYNPDDDGLDRRPALKPKTLKLRSVVVVASLLFACASNGVAAPQGGDISNDVSDATLVQSLPGFKNGFATVNGIRLHYVAGGKGSLVILLPGWPETWWAFHKIMPALATRYRVVAVDIRGMGTSDKPMDGYDKKTMAKDIDELVHQLGYASAYIVGHDIGSQVAFSVAANYPKTARAVAMLDLPHPDAILASFTLLPSYGTFGDRFDQKLPYPWWFAFHQVKGLPEDLLAGHAYLEQRWFFHYFVKNAAAIDSRDRAVYSTAYNSRDAIRAGDAWYQAFPKDILDGNTYAKVTIPVLGIGGPGFDWLRVALTRHATNFKVVKVNCGHFIPEEDPTETIALLLRFLR